MPRFDDRFARQNRCEPPPEFPLASPYPGIVHHLSGPRLNALTQIHPRTSGSVDDAPKLSPTFTFITRAGFTPKHSRITLTPWSVFQDGSLMTITPASLRSALPRSPREHSAAGYNTPRRGRERRGLAGDISRANSGDRVDPRAWRQLARVNVGGEAGRGHDHRAQQSDRPDPEHQRGKPPPALLGRRRGIEPRRPLPHHPGDLRECLLRDGQRLARTANSRRPDGAGFRYRSWSTTYSVM